MIMSVSGVVNRGDHAFVQSPGNGRGTRIDFTTQTAAQTYTHVMYSVFIERNVFYLPNMITLL